ncbi:helix-turn-helix transcriptional regulator [Paenibacillus thermotolerans]|uniref:helix-turn-helix transcriptional regulator n=1 Tax=Paenibacillus thermotolerans TaxID=3027807 RepID=UPI0023689A84|nr:MULTISPECIES: AraC family transcriptional regulator [unclassified Paenibacillus]
MKVGTLTDLTPALNFASRAFARPGDHWGPRIIPDCQFFYVISGEATLRLGPDHYRVLPGECVFYGRRSPHVLRTPLFTEYFSIHFSWHEPSAASVHPAYGLQEVGEDELQNRSETYVLEIPGHGTVALPNHFSLPGMEPLMMRIVKEYQQESLGSPFLLRGLLMELLASVLRQVTRQPSAGTAASKIEPALHAMREQLAKNWTVSELAKLCGYHPSYFTQLFFQELGINPKQYLITERIRLAKQALLRGEPIETVAERLGYGSVHYFSNNFKKETGLTPGEFRQTPVHSRDRSEEKG